MQLKNNDNLDITIKSSKDTTPVNSSKKQKR